MKYKLWCNQRECYSHNEHIFNSLEEIKQTLKDYHKESYLEACDTRKEESCFDKISLRELLLYYEWEIHNAKTEEFIFIK